MNLRLDKLLPQPKKFRVHKRIRQTACTIGIEDGSSLQVKRLQDDVILPKQATGDSAGFCYEHALRYLRQGRKKKKQERKGQTNQTRTCSSSIRRH
jgi:hypothetical protein